MVLRSMCVATLAAGVFASSARVRAEEGTAMKTGASDPAIRDEPTGSLSLVEVIALVSERSPALASEAWSVRAAEARTRYAGSLSNPEVTALVEDALGTGELAGFERSQVTLELGQVIELGGKRGARRALAGGEEDVARREYDHRRVELAGAATIAFIHVVADQQRVALAKRARELAAAAAEAAARRVHSGATSPVEEERARILVARAIIEEEHAAHELVSARRRLAAAWGSAEPRFTEAKADLFSRVPAPEFDELAARVDRNPELRRLAGERARRAAALDLARARAVPDVRTFGGVRRHEGIDETAFLGGVSVMLPVFDRNRGAVGEARALRSQIDDETAAVKVELLATMFTEYQELAHIDTALESLEKDVLPRAEKMLEAIDDGFRLGRFTQLELVDAQRTLVEVRNEHIDASEKYHVFVARLEMLLGEPLRGPSPRGQE